MDETVTSRTYRNRRIGDFLKELHLTEGRNTGLRKIRNAMKTNGSPAPLFKTDDYRSYILTFLPIHPDAALPENYVLKEGPVLSLSRVCPESVPPETARKIIRASKDAISLTDLMALLKQTNRTRFRRSTINPLIEAGLISMTIPDKPTSSKQEYKATERALGLIERRDEQ